MNKPATSRTIWTACAVISLPLVVTIVAQIFMLTTASRMSDDLKLISADVNDIASDARFTADERNRSFQVLLSQSRAIEARLQRP